MEVIIGVEIPTDHRLIMIQRKHRSVWSIRTVWSESLLCAQWVAKGSNYLHADSKDSDQTVRMPRLSRVFASRTSFCWFCSALTHILWYSLEQLSDWLIVLGFNKMSTLVGHFVLSPREREKRDRRDSIGDERERQEERGTGMKVKKKKK